MRKISFLLGVSVGFVLGSRAGRRPYEQMMSKLHETAGRPEVQETIGQVKDAAKDQAVSAARKAGWTPPSGESSGPDAATAVSPEPYADPKDLQFGTTVARREEIVDDLIKSGASLDDMDQTEAEMRDAGMLDEPRAANKAEPLNKS